MILIRDVHAYISAQCQRNHIISPPQSMSLHPHPLEAVAGAVIDSYRLLSLFLYVSWLSGKSYGQLAHTRPYKKISAFRVKGLKILGRVEHIFS